MLDATVIVQCCKKNSGTSVHDPASCLVMTLGVILNVITIWSTRKLTKRSVSTRLINYLAHVRKARFSPNWLIRLFKINLAESVLTLGPIVLGTIAAAQRAPVVLPFCSGAGFVCKTPKFGLSNFLIVI